MNINFDSVVLASAVRNDDSTSADQTNNLGKGVYLILDVTSAAGGGKTLELQLQGKDPASGKYYNLFVAATPQAGASTFVYLIHPDAGSAADGVTETRAYVLPLTWRVKVNHSAAADATYSVGAQIVL